MTTPPVIPSTSTDPVDTENSKSPQGPTKLHQERAKFIFMILSALFVGALVTTNFIANKFVTVDFGFASFVISAGILPYPLTFLVTDVLSEVYGRKRTNQVVISGFVVSVFVIFVLWMGSVFPAIENSPVNDDVYAQVFANTWRVISASMVAYLSAQLIDVRLFHFWKGLTKGRFLWLRNNASTIVSQLVDTTLVVAVLFLGQLSVDEMGSMIADGWAFKAIVALLDTIFIYLILFGMRGYLNLKPGEEIGI